MDFQTVQPLYRGYLEDESGCRGRGEKIAFPETAAEARTCMVSAQGKQLTIQGGRTGLMGGAVPEGGWILNLSRMTKIGEVRENTVRVEAGVTLDQLEKKLAPLGLRFPPRPTEGSATVGGLFGTNGAGPNRLQAGISSRYIRALLWLTREGQVYEIRRGQYPVKDGILPDGSKIPGTGDLIDCLAGTEGRWGAALELELQLLPIPRDQWGILFFFRDPEDGYAFGEMLEKSGPASLSAAEFFNRQALSLLREQKDRLKDLPALPPAEFAVLAELSRDGDCTEELLILADAFESLGGLDSWAENGSAGVKKLEQLGHCLTELTKSPLPRGDFRGPARETRQWIRDLEALASQQGIASVMSGHWGENSLRMDPPENMAEDRWLAFLRQAGDYVQNHGGSLRGTYGWGRVKRALYGEACPEGSGL